MVSMLLMTQGCIKKVEPSPETNSPGYIKVDKKVVEDTAKGVVIIVLLLGALYVNLILDDNDKKNNTL